MAEEYSLYDAKANLSRIVKQVRETRQSVVITVHGEPAVEIRAYQELPQQLEARMAELTLRGIVKAAARSPGSYVWTPRKQTRAGGLQRFLSNRDSE